MSLSSVLNPQTIKVTDMSPKCLPCDSLAKEKRGCWELVKNDSGAVFTFHGIYLAGTNQKDVEDMDSTKGFMEFDIITKKKLENKPFKSRTAIYFDKNEPVITNYATGRFKKSISPIFMAGYEKPFGKNIQTSNGIVVGIGLAPLAPYRPYFQVELYYKEAFATEVINVKGIKQLGTINVDSLNRKFEYQSYDSVRTNKISQIKLVPLQLRHNFGKYFSVGAGAVLSADIAGYTETSNTYQLLGGNGIPVPYTIANKEAVKAFSNLKALPFLDVQVGKVKLGPLLGLRYYYNGKNSSFGYFYAGWRL